MVEATSDNETGKGNPREFLGSSSFGNWMPVDRERQPPTDEGHAVANPRISG